MDAKNLGNCFVHCKIFELKLWRIEEEEGKEEETLLLNQAYALVVSELLYFPVATTVVLIKSAYAIAAEKRVINNLAKQRKMWQNNWLPRWRSYFDVEEIKTVIEMSFFVSFFIFFWWALSTHTLFLSHHKRLFFFSLGKEIINHHCWKMVLNWHFRCRHF